MGAEDDRMRSPHRASWAAAAAAVLIAAGARAAPSPPRIDVTGSYAVAGVDPRAAGVDVTFTASLFNQAASPVTGRVVLRDPALADRVFARFGRVTIPAGATVRVVAREVVIPEALFRSWSEKGAPGLFVDVENANGDVTLFRVPITKAVSG